MKATLNQIAPYLFFDGKCAEAMRFYQTVFRGDLQIMTYGEAQGDACPPAMKERAIHAALYAPQITLLASDTPAEVTTHGDTVHLSLACESLEQIETRFRMLKQGGEVLQDLHDAFWGARFGMLIDRYGFRWMLSFEYSGK